MAGVRAFSLFFGIGQSMDDTGRPDESLTAGATRLLSDDGAFEPDSCLFLGAAKVRAAMRLDGHLDVRQGHPAPDLVAEIDRSVDSRGKLAPYFRMGVREAWTWSRADGARIRVPDADAPDGFAAADRSRVLPGLGRDDLDRLLASRSPSEVSRRSRDAARRVARALLNETA